MSKKVDHCDCRQKHCNRPEEDPAVAKINTNKLMDKAFYQAMCPNYEHLFCERDVNCGFNHDKAANARRAPDGGDPCESMNIPAPDISEEVKDVLKGARQKASQQTAKPGKKKPRDDRDIYGMHNCDPHKYFKSGFGGFIPFTQDLVGMNSTAESHVGANRMSDFLDKRRCLEAMCREKYLNFDPCEVTKADVKRAPGWLQPDKAYEKCLREGLNENTGAMSSLPIGYRCDSDRNKELRAMMEAELKAQDGEDTCPHKKGDKCDCSPEDKKKGKENLDKKKDECQEASKCPSAKIDIGRRVIYDKKRGQIPGYGGHVPGLHVCTQGGNYGNETRRVLKQTVSRELLNKSGLC